MSNEAEARSQGQASRGLVPRVHAPVCGRPYFDEDLQVAQSKAHRIMIGDSVPILETIAQDAGLLFLSDESIWYLHPETDEQRVYYGDCVIARPVDHERITADDVLLVIEVVSTNDRRKELKDTRFQRLLNEYNAVPEFVLVFPDLDDTRALAWSRYIDGEYQEQLVAPGGHVISEHVPGLELRVLPIKDWNNGRKLAIYYRGEHRPRFEVERARADEQQARAVEQKARADEQQARADEQQARADRLAARLEAMGVELDEQ